MRRMKDKIEGTITNADSALAVENLSASVDVASSGQSADITLSSLTKAKAKLSVAVTGVATMGKKGTTDLTIDVPNQNDLLNALTNDDIDAITGGMVDDDGNPIKPNEVIVDASLTVSGRAADAKVTGTRISEALSIAKSADAGLTNVRTELDKLKLNSVAVDKTLTKENFAADAKAVGDALVKKASAEHNHDDRYYTEDEINVKLYTKAQVDNKIAAAIKVVKEEQKLLDHPVGSIYMSMNATEPSVLFGGTWERIKDRFILAAGDSYETGATGGEAEHKLTLTELPDRTVVAVKNESGNSVDISNAG